MTPHRQSWKRAKKAIEEDTVEIEEKPEPKEISGKSDDLVKEKDDTKGEVPGEKVCDKIQLALL